MSSLLVQFLNRYTVMATNSHFSQSVAVIDLNDGTQGGNGTIRQVLVTPMAPGASVRAMPPQTVVTRRPPKVSQINKVFLKAVTKENSKCAKTFTLRHINTSHVSNSDDLKELIKEKLGGDVKDCDDFDVGYVQGPGDRVVTIRTEEDLADVWREMRTPNSKIQLWCDGLRSGNTKNKKRRRQEQSDSESETDSQPRRQTKKEKKSAQQEREERVEESLDALKKKYGAEYTQMQYRIWAECIANGLGTLDNAPTSSMFKRAGNRNGSSKNASTKPSLSPAKIIDNRSKCYRQLSELRNLKDEGLISDKDYDHERSAIMGMLRKFQAV